MKKNIKIGYKVVCVEGGGLRSALVLPKNGGVKYRVGKWVKPKTYGGPLCVFDNSDTAYLMTTLFPGTRVYTCEYKPSRGESVYVTGLMGPVHLCSLPPDTRLARRVKLLVGVLP